MMKRQSIAVFISMVAFFNFGLLQAEFGSNPADIFPTGKVDAVDFSIFSAAWLSDDSPTANWNPDCDISEPNDGIIDELDLIEFTSNWLWSAVAEMALISIDDANFADEMSQYETTNSQYCRFLNAAFASGDITVGIDDVVYGASGSNGGADFVDEIYFETYAADLDSQIAFIDDVFIVRSRDGYDMSDHPVVEVSWYGATAFSNYYGFRLPSEWEWQAVADFDGTYAYGCGTTINQGKANYDDSGYANPLNLLSSPFTNPVDHYPSYGYGVNDMAGNVWEWTSSCYFVDCSDGSRVIRGGGWNGFDYNCDVSYRGSTHPFSTGLSIGFRVCR